MTPTASRPRNRPLALGIPDCRHLHVPREPLARRDAAEDGGLPAGVRRDVVDARRARVARGLVGGRARDRQPAGADPRRGDRTPSRCTRTSRSRRGSSRSCFTYDGPRRKIVMTELEFPSNHYLFEGFRRYGAEIVYVPSADPIRLDLAALPRRDRRADAARAAVAGAVQERLHHRRARGDREGAPRRGARHPRRLPGGRHGADGSRRAGTPTSRSAAR